MEVVGVEGWRGGYFICFHPGIGAEEDGRVVGCGVWDEMGLGLASSAGCSPMILDEVYVSGAVAGLKTNMKPTKRQVRILKSWH